MCITVEPPNLYNVAGLPPDHHGGRLEGVVPQPELPDDSPVVAVVAVHWEVFPIEICLKTAGMSIFLCVWLFLHNGRVSLCQ